MNIRIPEVICITVVLSSCVQPAVFKNDSYALVKSNYPIIAIMVKRLSQLTGWI
jgi:hypothetical protein